MNKYVAPRSSISHKLDLNQLRLGFFDLEAIIQSDSDRYLNLFRQMYRRFLTTNHSVQNRPTIEFTVLTKPDNPWGQPVLILDDEVRSLNVPGLLEGYVYESVFHTLLSRVKSHFLIHAGVVSYNDQGIILAADSGHGKTTLVLELVRRGFKFLSDEMAALGRAGGYVYPFPRSLRIRPGTLERAGFPGVAMGAPTWLGKLILDIEEIKPGSFGERARVNHIIILRGHNERLEQSAAGSPRELGISVDHLDDTLVSAIRQIAGVTDVQTKQDNGYPMITLSAMHRSAVLSKIENLCRDQHVLILDVIKRREQNPSFDSPARLERIAPNQCVMELIRRFQGGHKSTLLRDAFDGSSTRLFVDLATIINRANCYQLFVGRLSEMADQVCNLVDAP